MTRATPALLLLGLCLPATGCSDITPSVSLDLSALYDLAMPDLAMPDLAPPVDLTPPPDLAPPDKPLVGAAIDRVGRAGVNLALTNPFNLVPGSTTDAVRNTYNATTVGNWGSFAPRPYLAENLAIFDGLDGTCGNQLLAGAALTSNRYLVLANVLADDRLYVDATSGGGSSYLAVEQSQSGSSGGWHPSLVAMDITYNLLIMGKLTGGYTNGVTADGDGGIPMNAPFPFLLPPA